MMNKTVTFASLGGALLLMAASALQCRGAYAYNPSAGGWISHSICEDRLIAQVSGYAYGGKYGVKQNPNTKRDACMFAGSDIRIADLCAGMRPEDNGNRRH
jgi:hypothetical protein